MLFDFASQWLRTERIVRPTIDLVATARQRAHDHTFRLLEPLLTTERCVGLDRLLLPDMALGGRTRLAWLRRGAVAPTASAIREETGKVDFLRELGIDTWDLEAVTPDRRKFLAQIRATIDQPGSTAHSS